LFLSCKSTMQSKFILLPFFPFFLQDCGRMGRTILFFFFFLSMPLSSTLPGSRGPSPPPPFPPSAKNIHGKQKKRLLRRSHPLSWVGKQFENPGNPPFFFLTVRKREDGTLPCPSSFFCLSPPGGRDHVRSMGRITLFFPTFSTASPCPSPHCTRGRRFEGDASFFLCRQANALHFPPPLRIKHRKWFFSHSFPKRSR